MGYSKTFSDWCKDNNLHLAQNNEVFFINEKMSYKPEYIINYKIFVDILDDGEYTSEYAAKCERFKDGFAPIILIPHDLVPELHKITINDISERFNLSF